MLVLPAEARTFWNVKITKRSLRRLASELGCICNGNYEHVEILYILHVSNWKTTFLCQISIFLNNSILTWSASSDPPFLDSFNPQARDERWPILFLLSGVFLFFLLSGVFFSCATWDFFLLPHGTFFLGHPHPRRWLLQKWLVLAVANDDVMLRMCNQSMKILVLFRWHNKSNKIAREIQNRTINFRRISHKIIIAEF